MRWYKVSALKVRSGIILAQFSNSIPWTAASDEAMEFSYVICFTILLVRLSCARQVTTSLPADRFVAVSTRFPGCLCLSGAYAMRIIVVATDVAPEREGSLRDTHIGRILLNLA